MSSRGLLMRAVASKVPLGVLGWVGRCEHKHPAASKLLAPILQRMHSSDETIARGAGKGLFFNATGGIAGYTVGVSEPELQDTLVRLVKPGDVFYDVGASIGFFTVIAARLVGPRGRIVAIEPSAAAVVALRHNVELNGFTNVDVHMLALSSTSGMGILAEGDKLVWGKTTQTEDAGAANIPFKTLDELVFEHAVPAPAVIKMDIEGAETDALKGAAQTLSSHHPIVLCETHNTLSDITRILTEYDYDTRRLDGSPVDLAADRHFDYVLATPRSRAS